MSDKILLGSLTAKNGFKNEDDIVNKFNNWEIDKEAGIWLDLMGYKLNEIEEVKAVKIYGHKADVQAQITVKLKEAIDAQNIQVKLVSNKKGFNQIDKRWVGTYALLWNMPEEIRILLKKYCGEILPTIKSPRDKRRMYVSEFTEEQQLLLINWLKQNKSLIVSDVLKGRGQFAAEWMLVAQKLATNARWTLKPMNYCLNFFGNDDVEITKKGNINIGRIGMQRKGGDGGRNTAKMLQFKIDPTRLFED
jgi:hypothetical protein